MSSDRTDATSAGAVESDGEGNTLLYLFSALDNLLKGASGQAVQDFNIRFGFNPASGLPLRGEV